jgi:molecular chaperone GrpE
MQGHERAAAESTGLTDAPDTGAQPAIGSAAVTDVEKDLQAALEKANEHHDQFLRAKAETENVRRRAQEEISKAHKFAVESFAENLLPVIDSLEKALEVSNATPEAMREGIDLTLKQLKAAFDKAD